MATPDIVEILIPGIRGPQGIDGAAAPIANNTLLGNISGATAAPVGLSTAQVKTLLAISNVTNTSDADKPVSIAQAAADAAVAAASQPVNSGLTAISALTTTAYGRALLTLANQAALQSAVDAVVLSGSYADPSWITALDWAKIVNEPDFARRDTANTFVGNQIVTAADVFAAPHKVYLMGDSLTGVSGQYGTQLQANLGSEWTVVWKGISGNTTSQMVTRFVADVITPAVAEYVVILGGVNDLAQGVATSTIKTNLQTMYSLAKAAGIKVVAVTIAPFSGDAGWSSPSDGPVSRQKQYEINDWILRHALDVDYRVDLYSVMVDPSVPWTLLPAYDDGGHIHFTTLGYNTAGTAIYNGVSWAAVKATALLITGPSSFIGQVDVTGSISADNLSGVNTGDENFGQDILSVSKAYGTVTHAAPTPSHKLSASLTSAYFGIEFLSGGALEASIKQLPVSGYLRLNAGRSSGWGGRLILATDTVDAVTIYSSGSTLFAGTVTAPSFIAASATLTAATPIIRLNSENVTTAQGIEWTSDGGAQPEAHIKHTVNSGDMHISAGRSSGWGGAIHLIADTVTAMDIRETAVYCYVPFSVSGNITATGLINVGSTDCRLFRDSGNLYLESDAGIYLRDTSSSANLWAVLGDGRTFSKVDVAHADSEGTARLTYGNGGGVTTLYGNVAVTGTVTATGFGVGSAADAATPFRALVSSNASIGMLLNNTSTGPSAATGIIIESDAGQAIFRQHSLAHSVWAGKTLLYSPSGSTGLVLGTGGADPVEFYTNNSLRATISDTGVTITGNFAALEGKLGNSVASVSEVLQVGKASGNSVKIQLFQDGVEDWRIGMNASSALLRFKASGTDVLTLDSSGNVTATGNITATGTRPVQINSAGGHTLYTGDSGGWVTGSFFNGPANTALGQIGLVGNNNTPSYYYMGEFGAEAFKVTQVGNATFAGTATLGIYSVATLPSAAANSYAEANINDGLAPAMGMTVVGGGAVKTKVRSNGTNWTVCGI